MIIGSDKSTVVFAVENKEVFVVDPDSFRKVIKKHTVIISFDGTKVSAFKIKEIF